MLIKPRIGFTYDCEHCKKPVSGSVELFTLYDKPYTHSCECGNGFFSVFAQNGHIFIDYPCSLCGKRHDYSVSAAKAMDGITALQCPEFKLPACFIGVPELIDYMDSEAAEEELQKLIRSLLLHGGDL